MIVSSREQAWKEADRLFPTDYFKNYGASDKAGYDIYNSTITGEMSWIADLGSRLELNIFVEGGGVDTINIFVEEPKNEDKALEIEKAYLAMDEAQRETFLDACKLMLDENDYKIMVIHLKSLEVLAKTPKSQMIKKAICEQFYNDLRSI